ncbi:hypothetical protein IWX49DRAFT_576174 [Phyllosticta citricarpa]
MTFMTSALSFARIMLLKLLHCSSKQPPHSSKPSLKCPRNPGPESRPCREVATERAKKRTSCSALPAMSPGS